MIIIILSVWVVCLLFRLYQEKSGKSYYENEMHSWRNAYLKEKK